MGTNVSVVTTQPTLVTQPLHAVPDTLPISICATLCCIWLGIYAIIRTNEVRLQPDPQENCHLNFKKIAET